MIFPSFASFHNFQHSKLDKINLGKYGQKFLIMGDILTPKLHETVEIVAVTGGEQKRSKI